MARRHKKRWLACSPSGAPLSSHRTRGEAEFAEELAEAYRRLRQGLTTTARQREMVDADQMRRG